MLGVTCGRTRHVVTRKILRSITQVLENSASARGKGRLRANQSRYSDAACTDVNRDERADWRLQKCEYKLGGDCATVPDCKCQRQRLEFLARQFAHVPCGMAVHLGGLTR